MVLATAVAALATTGCDGLSAARARRAADHVYAEPCKQIEHVVDRVFRARGEGPTHVTTADERAIVVGTDWRGLTTFRGEPPRRVRYKAYLTPDAADRACRVRVVRLTSGAGLDAAARDLDVEWEVLASAEPASAHTPEAPSARPAALASDAHR